MNEIKNQPESTIAFDNARLNGIISVLKNAVLNALVSNNSHIVFFKVLALHDIGCDEGCQTLRNQREPSQD
jgi:hypothetical protein